jgi:hypothetical protein
MKMRSVSAALGLLIAVLLLPVRTAAKEATVTLEVTGMS